MRAILPLLTATIWLAGHLSLVAQTPLPAGDSPCAVAVGDVNGDGRADVVVANRNSNDVSLYLQNASGSLIAQSPLPAGSGPAGVAVGDVDGDGRADVLVANIFSANATFYRQDASAGGTLRVRLS